MDKSFHYYCIRVLAEKAGFSAHDAQTIAYASQYTDDATEYGKMKILNIPASFQYPRFDKHKNSFDPICTAHSAKNWMAKVWKWAKFYLKPDVQRKVLMSFHFLPPLEKTDQDNDHFDFVTQKNSPLANMLIDLAMTCFSGSTLKTKEYALIKLGIALHTYADTWSHAGFSGRHNSKENDIKKVKIRQKNSYKLVNPLELVISYAAPDVGHSEANVIPDQTKIEWKAGYANKKGSIIRSNTSEFLESAKQIYSILTKAAKKAGVKQPGMEWRSLSPKIKKCLQTDDNWGNIFGDIFSYSRFDWRGKALTGDIHWDNFDDESDFHKLNLKYTGKDMKWFLFHKAAFEQRRFVAQRIPETWTNG